MPSPLIWRVIWATAFIVIVVALSIAALPYIASTRIVRDRIAWEMSAWSGFRVTIGDDPQIEVWPKFHAILTDVTLSRWTAADAAPVLQAERVEIDLSAMAALRGNVVFSGARFIRPTLRVENTQSGLFLPPMPAGGRLARAIDTARDLVAADAAKPDLSKLPTDPFGTIELKDGRIVASSDGKDDEIVTSLSGQANWAALNSNATLSASGIWRGESVTLDASSAKPLILFAGGNSPVTIAFKAAPANFSFDGTASLADSAFVDGQAKFSAPSLRRLLEWSRVGPASNAAIGAVSVTSKVSGGSGRIKLENAEITLDKNPGMGAIDLAYADARPMVSGTLAFDTLDLRAFLSAFTPLASPNGSGEIDPAFADRFNLDLRLSAARASIGSVQLTDVAATAQVKDGLAVFDISDAAAFNGNVQGSLRFDRKPEGSQVEMRLLASDIEGGAFGTAAGMTRLIPVATGTVSLILKGQGTSWDSILESADGSVSATFGPGALTGFNLPSFLKRSEDGGFFALDDVSDGNVQIDGAEVKASISRGVARLDKAEANSAKYKIWLSGIVPYAGRGLALSGGIVDGQTTASTGTATPNDPARRATFFVGGTWSTPFISPVGRSFIGEGTP